MINKNISIIAADCGSQEIHKAFDLQYCSPFVDIKIFPHEYLYMLQHFNHINWKNIREVNKEMFVRNGAVAIDSEWPDYPIVCVDNQFIIHPQHNVNFIEFQDKWNRRIDRMNYRNLLFVVVDDQYSGDYLRECIAATAQFAKIIITRRPQVARDIVHNHKEIFIQEYKDIKYHWDDNYYYLLHNDDFKEWFKHVYEYTKR